jgi:hypothetical protein
MLDAVDTLAWIRTMTVAITLRTAQPSVLITPLPLPVEVTHALKPHTSRAMLVTFNTVPNRRTLTPKVVTPLTAGPTLVN